LERGEGEVVEIYELEGIRREGIVCLVRKDGGVWCFYFLFYASG